MEPNRSFRPAASAVAVFAVLLLTSCGPRLDSVPNFTGPGNVPLDAEAWWPKFRANPRQNGRINFPPDAGSPAEEPVSQPWEFPTGKGVFSSPVIDGEGNIYIGSADHFFYCLHPDGTEKWRFATGEIIDSSALLDDRGRVYFGSGDRHVYCLDRDSGRKIWSFEAHTPEEVEKIFGIRTFNVAWFEGNIAMLPDGDILAPNDNYLLYRLDRDNGAMKSVFPANEMIWSLPVVDESAGRIYFGSNFNLVHNIFCYDAETGKRIWRRGGLGTNAASPLLAGDAVVVGGYDGYLRAYSRRSGRRLWKFGTRDHIYSSPAQLSDGTIIQASADGTVYALDPGNGRQRWAFDSLEPIRSSAAVDIQDRIYFGTGSGHLFCLNSDGTFRWKYLCIDDVRNDLNGSPALGPAGIVIAGESGGVFHVPYDYPLSDAGRIDPRADSGGGEDLPDDGVSLLYTTPFAGLVTDRKIEIGANDPVTLSLFVRQAGDTVLAAMDRDELTIEFDPPQEFRHEFSANDAYLALIPQESWSRGMVKLRVTGEYLTGRKRLGLMFRGGRTAGRIEEEFSLDIRRTARPALPLNVPDKTGSPATLFEISRLSCPYPTMLPSYNQIGFDSLHYLASVVEADGDDALLWVIQGKLDEATGRTVAAPEYQDIFVLNLHQTGSELTLATYDDVSLKFVGSWDMPFSLFRLAGDSGPIAAGGRSDVAFNCIARGDDIEFYGRFLKLAGMADRKTGHINVVGGASLGLLEDLQGPPETDIGAVSLEWSDRGIQAVFSGSGLKVSEHNLGILLVDTSSRRAVPADYARGITVTESAGGILSDISLSLPDGPPDSLVRVYVMVDGYPVHRQEIIVPLG